MRLGILFTIVLEYLTPSILPSTMTVFTVPPDKKAQIMLSPPCFRMLSFVKSNTLCQGILFSSDQKTFCLDSC